MSLTGSKGEDIVWQRFLAWLGGIAPADNPGTVLQEYRKHLMATGTLESEAGRQLGIILGMMRTRQDGWQVMFNKIYANPTAGYTARPNALLQWAVQGRTPGRALDAGMGQGRNSVFLAMEGWEVTGFDVSEQGLAMARASAEQAGVRIQAVQTSEGGFQYGNEAWDLIVMTYEPFPVEEKNYADRIWNALRPGGVVVIESFAAEATAKNRRPVDIDAGLLRAAFADFRILRLEEAEGTPDWTTAETRLVRMVAEKAP